MGSDHNFSPEILSMEGEEKGANIHSTHEGTTSKQDESTDLLGGLSLWHKLADYGVELRGVEPVPEEERTDTRFINIGTLLGTSLLCLLPLTTGILGTLEYGLSLRDSSLVIIFFCLLTAAPPCYICTISPQTGMRQMVQARYSFGYYLNILPVILNMCGIMGFTMISAVVGGQCLVAVSNDGLSTNAGIVIISVISMLLTMAGYKILHAFLRYAWIPALIAIVIAVGVGGRHLKDQTPTKPASAQAIISFGSLMAGYMLPFASTLGDYCVYMPRNAPRHRIFLYAYLGLCIPSIFLMILGAAIGATVPQIQAWNDAYEINSIGGVMAAMLEPAGGFGRFVTVILGLSVIANTAPSVYSISLNFQVLIPGLHRIPRIIWVVVATAILIGVAIGAAQRFIDSLEGFLGIISYWAASFAGISITEWIVIRHRNPETYDPKIWNDYKLLPTGIPALVALVIAFAVAIPFMDQNFYQGPVAKKTGDLGFEVALAITPFIYYPLRLLDIKLRDGRL